ncbi:DUF6578 domain-containing protein [Actinomadura hibisca]|uniref:DUF6578 domain-containing protein n=1 Tax=Actinomadura hibisca TaxID=68565 RepID=UPI00083244EF|nr:DUF6578 domain-containing protein [Actinomadura hibisca]
MKKTVWMDAWQMECCGDPYSVGSTVTWTLGDLDRAWLTTVLGAETAAKVNATEEHHTDTDRVARISGEVKSISAVHCRYAPRPGGDTRTYWPVAGTTVLTRLTSTNDGSPDRDDLRFVGYLVQIAEH